jgi:hypothetical protein
MRKMLGLAVAGLALAGTTACYHATVDTGRPATGPVIDQPWANSFVYGLVPPATVETASKCPNGVAKVETQMSFLNGLVSSLTFGIYTPMTITVHCAGSGSALAPAGAEVVRLPARASHAALGAALDRAAQRSADEHAPVYVAFGELDD